MFPTFDVPPQHAETVGARKARRAKEEETARRSSSATSQSSGSIHSAKAHSSKSKAAEKNGFGWFGKSSKKGVQEISSLPSTKKPPPPLQEPEPEFEPCPPTAPLPPPPSQELHRKISNRSDHDTVIHAMSQNHHYPPPLRALPPRPPSSALPQVPGSPSLLSQPGTLVIACSFFAFAICTHVAALAVTIPICERSAITTCSYVRARVLT